MGYPDTPERSASFEEPVALSEARENHEATCENVRGIVDEILKVKLSDDADVHREMEGLKDLRKWLRGICGTNFRGPAPWRD